MNEELLKILQMLKEDFEMLQDGSWDLNYSDGSEIQASLDNCLLYTSPSPRD